MQTGGPASRRRGFFGAFPWKPLLVLGVLLVILRAFFCAILRVPTGSMEPTLHGDPVRGDELLVFTPWYRLFSLDRFDLVVFRRDDPAAPQEKLQVKRAVAFGGESIYVLRGDLFIGPVGQEQRVVKTYSEFHDLLVPLWREPFDGGCLTRLGLNRASARVVGNKLQLDGGSSRADASTLAVSSDFVSFTDGWVDSRNIVHPGDEAVRDVLVAAEITLASHESCIAATLWLGRDALEFVVQPRSSSHLLEVRHRVESLSGQEETFSTSCHVLEPGKTYKVEIWHIDGQVGFAIDGRIELAETLLLLPRNEVGRVGVTGFELGFFAGGASVSDLSVWRDLHYTTPEDASFAAAGAPFRVPDGELFVLGDHSAESIDSRYFGAIPRANLEGRPLLGVGPAGRRRIIR